MGEPNPRWYGTTYGNLKWLNLYSIGTIFWAHHCIRFIQAHPGLYSHSKAKAAEWSSIFNFVFDMDGCWSALTVESWHQDFSPAWCKTSFLSENKSTVQTTYTSSKNDSCLKSLLPRHFLGKFARCQIGIVFEKHDLGLNLSLRIVVVVNVVLGDVCQPWGLKTRGHLKIKGNC